MNSRHILNQKTTLVFNNQQKGSGFWKREPNKFPPKTRSILEKHKDKVIKKIVLVKYLLPDVSFITKVFSKSGGKKLPYDRIYHLAANLQLEDGTKLEYEKDAVITLKQEGIPKNKPLLETMDVPLKYQITLDDLIKTHQKKMRPSRYFRYTLSQNCQDFIKNMLQVLDVWDEKFKDFVLQDPNLIRSDLPNFADKAVDVLRELKLLISRRIEGEGAV